MFTLPRQLNSFTFPQFPDIFPTTCLHLSSPPWNEKYLYDPFVYRIKGIINWEGQEIHLEYSTRDMDFFSGQSPKREAPQFINYRGSHRASQVPTIICSMQASTQTNLFQLMHLPFAMAGDCPFCCFGWRSMVTMVWTVWIPAQ